MQIKVLFNTSKRIHQKFGELRLGKYTIEPVPTNEPNLSGASNRYLLRFEDTLNGGRSNPKEDANFFLSYLSLALGSKINIESFMVNSAQLEDTRTREIFRSYYSIVNELDGLDLMYTRFHYLDIDIARQFVRACEVYRTAVNIIDENSTLSFFLLTIAVECLSNVVSNKKGACEKFVDFVLKFLPDKSDFENIDQWNEILKEIYYNHRSGFTHGGKRVPEAVRAADRLERAYIQNVIGDKDVKTPGLKWFERVVRSTLTSYLINQDESKSASQEPDYFKKLSLEIGLIKFRF